MRKTRRWSDLTPRQRRWVLVAGAVQLSLAAAAWTDLARRPATEVNGPKGLWAGVISVNFVGPLAYFLRGRRGPNTRPPTG
jgi:Phospholipase_D-nuclease N-terminal